MPEVFTQSDPPKLIETGEELTRKLQAPLIQPTTHKDLISEGEDAAEEENLIVGTNTPRAKRSNAYYDLLCAQGSHDRSAVCRGMDAAESAVRGVEQAVSYQDDFTTDAVQNAGLHTAAAQLIVEGNAVTAVADSAVVLGGEVKAALRDMRDGTLDAKDALHSGGKVLRLQGGKAVVRVGAAAGRSAERYAASFRTSAEDFADSTPNQIKDTALQTWRTAGGIKTLLRHPIQSALAAGKLLLVAAGVLLFLVLVSLLGQMAGTTVTTVFCTEKPSDIPTLVQNINDYRNAALTEELYAAFRNDTDPNGNPYGYTTLTDRRSNNLQHGVTWNYANGIYNDTAEIVSMAAVYFRQDWPTSAELAAFDDSHPFTRFCRALTAYGLQVTARESAPYSCMTYGGCVYGYRSEGETVTITDYRLFTHTCSEGSAACGHYTAAHDWLWNAGHTKNGSTSQWIADGTHEVTVFFPVLLPDGASACGLTDLPTDCTAISDGTIRAEACRGNLVLGESANLYTGIPNDWFAAPNEGLSATFTVITTDGDASFSQEYTVHFTNATAVAWCPGELHDGQYGHYDLDCTIYLTGCDRYTDPETKAPNGAAGGTGNLEALAQSCNDGTLTRTIIKQDQYGSEYAGNAVSARFTKTVTLPQGSPDFAAWYKDGADAQGNVAWASLLYRMDWQELYGVTDGIKCRATGTGMTEEELQRVFASLNIDPTTARGQIVAFALGCQGRFVYAQPTSLRGGPGSPSVGINLDCSSFIQYCYWAQGLPFSAGNTASYRHAADLQPISPSEVQPGDLRVVYADGHAQGHVQMALGGGAWIECCYGYGVAVNRSNAWMESRPCHYFRYGGF